MSKSSITLTIAGLVFIASTIVSFVVGASVNREAVGAAGDRLTLVNNEVRYNDSQQHRQQQPQQGPAPAGVFTYQGVLLDGAGDPAIGPVGLEFIVSSVNPVARIHTQVTVNGLMPDAMGRLTVDLPLPDASTMSIWTDFFLTIRDPITLDPIIDELPMAYAPLAWISQHARSSDTAVFANNAIFADLAQEADALSDDDTAVLTLTSDFSPAPIGGQPPAATRLGNMVFLSGTFRNDINNPNSAVLSTLPANMRPSQTHIAAMHVALSTTSGNAALTITPDGTIRLLSPAYTPGFVFFLNGVYFPVD